MAKNANATQCPVALSVRIRNGTVAASATAATRTP